MRRRFEAIAGWMSEALGSPIAFALALSVVVLWFAVGPLVSDLTYSELLLQSWPTITTFLILFLMRNAENRHNKAVQIKLDELLRALHGARTGLVDIEQMPGEDLTTLQELFSELHRQHADDMGEALDSQKTSDAELDTAQDAADADGDAATAG